MRQQPNRPLTSDPADRGVPSKPSLGMWVRYHLTPDGNAVTREPKPRRLFPQPEGEPPAGWTAPDTPEDARLRREAEVKVSGPKPVAPAARPVRRPVPRPPVRTKV